jgi:hypothetical protein
MKTKYMKSESATDNKAGGKLKRTIIGQHWTLAIQPTQ